ncbi:MAG: lipoyl(octanoyl) transferase LipB [Mariprofundaceae bacterium]
MTFHLIRHAHQTYEASIREQETSVAMILSGKTTSTLIFTEHPPLYTIGTSGDERDVLQREIDGTHIDLQHSGRGGQVTYHGPGQLVCYVLADLREERDLHRHVWKLEEMMIRTLADFDIESERSAQGIGVWVKNQKIASVGVRCRRWITWHGIAVNHKPNLKHFEGIIPCGMQKSKVTSIKALNTHINRLELEEKLYKHANQLWF